MRLCPEALLTSGSQTTHSPATSALSPAAQSVGGLVLPGAPAEGAALLRLRGQPLGDALQVEGVPAHAPDHWAVVPWELAVRRAAVKGHPADAADVVAGVPGPGRHRMPVLDGHLWPADTSADCGARPRPSTHELLLPASRRFSASRRLPYLEAAGRLILVALGRGRRHCCRCSAPRAPGWHGLHRPKAERIEPGCTAVRYAARHHQAPKWSVAHAQLSGRARSGQGPAGSGTAAAS